MASLNDDQAHVRGYAARASLADGKLWRHVNNDELQGHSLPFCLGLGFLDFGVSMENFGDLWI